MPFKHKIKIISSPTSFLSGVEGYLSCQPLERLSRYRKDGAPIMTTIKPVGISFGKRQGSSDRVGYDHQKCSDESRGHQQHFMLWSHQLSRQMRSDQTDKSDTAANQHTGAGQPYCSSQEKDTLLFDRCYLTRMLSGLPGLAHSLH